ncbi:MAG: FAD-binding oxidoreductase [Pseudomonadota bacterium]|nr:FAD-binding oxidoreductase [Pseudomonadota bacterium]
MNAPLTQPTPDLLSRFSDIVGDRNAISDPEAMRPYLVEWRDRYFGKAALVLRPGSVEEVSAILRLASEARVGIVPQGGNTGLVGGQIPYEHGNELVLSLARLNRIRDVDPEGNTMVAEAGVTLGEARQAADAVDRLFPLSLPSEGTCTIGGNLATNAGGVSVLAYGNTRDLTLGVEVVLADGRLWNGLRRLRKDNTGYDLKDLFVGSEGTLGVITAAALKLLPKPKAVQTAFVGLDSPEAAIDLLNLALAHAGGQLVSFELLPRIGIEFTLRHGAGARDPLQEPHAWYVLLELASGRPNAALDVLIEALLGEALESGTAADAALAQSLDQRAAFWRLRELMTEVQRYEGGSIKHDVSVPVAKVPDFLRTAIDAVERLIPGSRPVPFGHVGDGNIHFNVSQPVSGDKAAFLDRWEEVSEVVHGIVARYDGSISAEHGIGRMKRHLLPSVKDPVELDLMSHIKSVMDPLGILNPAKLL